MFERLSRYSLRIEDEQLWETTLGRPEPEAVDLLASLEGFRGAWVARSDVADGSLEAVFVSLWETRDQAEAVRELLGEQVAELFAREGVGMTGPPSTEILTFMGGRMG
jgi:heme-degrading monooxygenase HmoA